jgi:hypothetical protein
MPTSQIFFDSHGSEKAGIEILLRWRPAAPDAAAFSLQLGCELPHCVCNQVADADVKFITSSADGAGNIKLERGPKTSTNALTV